MKEFLALAAIVAALFFHAELLALWGVLVGLWTVARRAWQVAELIGRIS